MMDFSALLCRECLDGIKPIAVIIYDNKVPIKMAIELDSVHSDWRVRLCELQGFTDGTAALYGIIEELIDVKVSMM